MTRRLNARATHWAPQPKEAVQDPLTIDTLRGYIFSLAGELAMIGVEPDITVDYTQPGLGRTPRRVLLPGFDTPKEAELPRSLAGWSLERLTAKRFLDNCTIVETTLNDESHGQPHTRSGFVLGLNGNAYQVTYSVAGGVTLSKDALHATSGDSPVLTATRVVPIESIPAPGAEAMCNPVNRGPGSQIDHLAGLTEKLMLMSKHYGL